jgi:hypothetical protein
MTKNCNHAATLKPTPGVHQARIPHMPDAAQALFQGLLTVIGRFYWNREQEDWDRIQNPDIPGMQ